MSVATQRLPGEFLALAENLQPNEDPIKTVSFDLVGDEPFSVEITSDIRDGHGLRNDLGNTSLMVNGLFVDGEDWRDEADRRVREAKAEGKDLTVVAINDQGSRRVKGYVNRVVRAAIMLDAITPETNELDWDEYSKGTLIGSKALPIVRAQGVKVARVNHLAGAVVLPGLNPLPFVEGLYGEAKVALQQTQDPAFRAVIRRIMERTAGRLKDEKLGLLIEVGELLGSLSVDAVTQASRLEGTSAEAHFFNDDGIIGARRAKQKLEHKNFNGPVLLHPGNHMTPLKSAKIRAELRARQQADPAMFALAG